ncbi:UNVERIFIED_CONTAM: hypothetical protein Sradi_7254200 [Sesamum radiatum]|uniref:Reverse transcriptase domain-containing protein n=1 Tax=Sesamum radiatum TaxID=300843 RepID=A0AAW2IMB7_SESRA
MARRLGFLDVVSNCGNQIWFFWGPDVTCQVLVDQEQLLHVRIESNKWPKPLFVTAVYAKCDTVERRALWDALRAVSVDCALVDAGYVGSPYTWYCRRLRQRLNRVLISRCWMTVFPKMQVAHLELSRSDHRGLLVEAECTVEQKVSSFRFQHMWTTHSEFLGVVCWNCQYPTVGSGMMRLQQELTRLKHCLKEWNKTVFGNVFDNVAAAERGLKEADEAYDQDPCDRTLVERNRCSTELVRVLAQEEAFWRQKAGIRWLKMGSETCDISTLWYRSGDFEQLLTAEPVFPEEMDSEHLEDGSQMRIDGLLTEFFSGEKMPKGFTATTISLIPKTASPTCWSEYRPISLCNVTNKICTKLMTNWLGHALPKVISLSQSGFVPERLLSDNVLLAQELIHSLDPIGRMLIWFLSLIWPRPMIWSVGSSSFKSCGERVSHNAGLAWWLMLFHTAGFRSW